MDHQMTPGKTRNSTMKELARQAGVSVSTVSHVINKTRNVERKTEEKVLKTIIKLNYKPNILARSLKGKGTKTIGVLISDIRDTFFSDAVKSVESEANDEGYNVILCDAEGDYQKEAEYIDILLRKGIDGLIFAPVDRGGLYEELIRSKVPAVQIDRRIDGSQFDFVGIDNLKSAEHATVHLLDHGFKKIGFVGYERRYYTMEMRLKGYEKAVSDRGLERKSLITSRGHGGTIIKNEIKNWLFREKMEAVLCGNDDICFETLLALEELELGIPDDIGIVTFDDVKWLQFLKCPISAIRQPAGEIGSVSLHLLVERIKNKKETKTRVILLEAALVERKSCGPPG